MQYKVIKADKTGEWEGKFGLNHRITLVLENPSGETVIATVNQKPETPLPQGTIEGEISEGKYGKEFKKTQTFPSGAGGPKPYGKSPEDTKNERLSIQRQTALKSAVELAVGNMAATGKAISSTEVLKIAGEFDKWLVNQIVPASAIANEMSDQEAADALNSVFGDE